MRELHLFAGIGGGILGGLLLGHVPVCAVEIDPYCRKVLRARQADGLLPDFPILDDVRQFDATAWRGRVDVVCGGFPCQPWSTAGKRLGTADPRHLWPEMARVVAECRPRYVFAENVALAAFQEPYGDLVAMGYRVPPALCLGAAHVGAPHLRKRWWLLAADADGKQHEGGAYAIGRAGAEELPDAPDADGGGMHERNAGKHIAGAGRVPTAVGGDGGEGAVADANRESRGGEVQPRANLERNLCVAGELRDGEGEADGALPGNARSQQPAAFRAGWWATEPRVGRVAHGVPSRVDRLRALGNAQVPAVAAAAFAELYRRLGA